MSKTKIPTIQKGAGRADLIAFREDTRQYAQTEFQKGVSAEEVYARVTEKAGMPLPAIRMMLNAEHARYLGINLRKLRILTVLVAMITYFVATGFAPQGSPVTRIVLPMLIAIAVGFLVQNLMMALTKKLISKKAVG